MAALMIVHHMKKLVNVSIGMAIMGVRFECSKLVLSHWALNEGKTSTKRIGQANTAL